MSELEVAIKASREAGAILLKHFSNNVSVERKNPRDIVTQADLESEQKIISTIKEHFPDHNILAEESGMEENNSEFLWIIDPLDGTSNFFKGQKDFCVLISFAQRGNTVFGITYFPLTEELFIAEKGKGATKNGKPIRVSSETDIQKMYATTQMASNLENRKLNVQLYAKLILQISNIHVFNACIARALTDVAEGVADFQFRRGFHLWDYAAGALLAEEAGGTATDFEGNPITRETKDTLVSNGKIHPGLLGLMRESAK